MYTRDCLLTTKPTKPMGGGFFPSFFFSFFALFDSLPSDANNFFSFLLGIVKIKCISTTVVLEKLMTMISIKGR